MGKLRPWGHMRPIWLFNPARPTCLNDVIYFLSYISLFPAVPAFDGVEIDGVEKARKG